MFLYLYVSFKNPGYVTTYVSRGDDFEDDIENSRKNNRQVDLQEPKKPKHKVKKV